MAAKSVRLYVDKNYRYHYLSILGYEPPENQSLETVSAKMRSGGIDEDISSDEELVEKEMFEGDQRCQVEGVATSLLCYYITSVYSFAPLLTLL